MHSIAIGEGLAILNKDVLNNTKLFFTSTDRDPNGRFQKEIKLPTGEARLHTACQPTE